MCDYDSEETPSSIIYNKTHVGTMLVGWFVFVVVISVMCIICAIASCHDDKLKKSNKMRY